ncbi:DUF4270 family protein [Adhaeribacter aquaticus]|uniref:DUF4270 family protein n=1 Tax=Adhaeribacter aquaticus TaxID=299567 RepID=UPI0003FC9826|nr:DUF4270 family protein [Adhaeribacter aquaticus]
MNWLTRTPVLFTFILFTFFACEEPNNIGLDGAGQDVLLGTTHIDTLTIRAATVLDTDSVLAYKRGSFNVGQFSNANFGTVSSKTFVELGVLPGVGIPDAANATVDSVVLALDYDEYFGDTTQNLTVNIHKLQERFEETKTYYTNSKLNHESAPVGSLTFKPTPKASKKVTVTTSGSSSVVARSFPARVRLDNNFGKEVITKAGTGGFANQAAFVNFLSGIAITSDNNAKAALVFRQNSDSTYLKIYYKTGTTKGRYQLGLNSNNNYFNQVTVNRTGTPLATLQRPGDSVRAVNTNNLAFLQESVGLKVKLTLPYFNKLKQTIGNKAVINRAELIVPVVNSSTNTPSTFAYLFNTSKSNRIIGGNNAVPQFPATYNSETKTFTFTITNYVQALVNGTRSNTGLILSPSSLAYDRNSVLTIDILAYQTLRQTILNTAPNQLKLRIYYSAEKQ